MKPRIVCVVTSLNEAVTAKKCGADLIELRADLLNNFSIKNISLLKSLVIEIKKRTNLPVICTIRSKSEGGKYSGTNSAKEAAFLKIAPFCDFIDIELNSPVISSPRIKNFHGKIILSKHYFANTPSFNIFSNVVKTAVKYKPAIIKIASKTKDLRDIITFARLQKSYSGCNLALVSMGDCGRLGRLLMPILGSKLTYGFAGRSIVQGQVHIKELSNLKPFLF